MNVDGARDLPLKAGVEQPIRILQGGPFGERHLDVALVSFSRADNTVVVPDWDSFWVTGLLPLLLFNNLWVCLIDELTYSTDCSPAPIV